ncbi:MAG: hypothetical protein ACLT2Z_02545 [Eubacterium sp.]
MEIFRDTKGFIFDLDGTIDSTNVWADIDEKFLGLEALVPEDYMQISHQWSLPNSSLHRKI